MKRDIVKLLKDGEIGIIPTDTIYGLVGSALLPETVEKIYQLRRRDKGKPMIILISDISYLQKFDIEISVETKEILQKLWPNPVSVILPCTSEKFTYLHRGQKSLAFRMPNDRWLLDLLEDTGPLVAPSANVESQPVSETIDMAKKYFGDKVSFYLDKGKIQNKPSTLIEIQKAEIKILRQGEFRL